MATASEHRIKNRLLSALPDEEFERLEPVLGPVTLSLGEILFEPPDPIRNAYFPTSTIISFLVELPDGDGMEVGMTGREGLVGIDVILGVGKASKVATVQGAGDALKIASPALKEAFDRGGKLEQYLLQYTHAMMSQISASMLCNIRHNIDERLARWLLMYCDGYGSEEFYLTHEFMANLLGVRRASVSVIAKQLQDEGLIDYNRGQFRILSREGLEAKTCQCYSVVKGEFDNLYRNAPQV
jgi:CRP-like cAMP-binding protein